MNESYENSDYSEKSEKKRSILESLNLDKIDEFLEKARDGLQENGLLKIVDDMVFWTSYPSIHLALKGLFKFKIKGKENVPLHGPAILVMNLQSDMDPFLLNFASPRKVRWFVQEKSVNIPLFKTWIKSLGFIVMPPDMDPRQAAPKIIEMLNEGQVVGLFPEHEKSVNGKLGEFHRTPARFCLQMKVPYIPVALKGSREAFPNPKDPTKAKIGSTIEVTFGKLTHVDPSLEQTPEDALKVAKQMKKQIRDLLR